KAERRSSRFALAPERGIIAAGDPATAVHEGVEHHADELVGHLERDLLRAGGWFAGELVQRGGKVIAGQVEQRRERQRQRAAVVEEVVDRVADVELVGGEAR